MKEKIKEIVKTAMTEGIRESIKALESDGIVDYQTLSKIQNQATDQILEEINQTWFKNLN